MDTHQLIDRREFLAQSTLAPAALMGMALLPADGFAAEGPRFKGNKVRVAPHARLAQRHDHEH
jgi:hypothetical protein